MSRLGALSVFALMIAALPAAAEDLSQNGVSPNDVTGAISSRAQRADGIPSFDIMRNCGKAFVSKEASGVCISREQISAKKLEEDWASLSPRVKHICVTRVPEGVSRAYESLADCALKESRLEKFRTIESER